MGTTLADLVKGFRHNVREGNPCEMRFNGEKIQLYPLPFEVGDREAEDKFNRTYVGITFKPSIKS